MKFLLFSNWKITAVMVLLLRGFEQYADPKAPPPRKDGTNVKIFLVSIYSEKVKPFDSFNDEEFSNETWLLFRQLIPENFFTPIFLIFYIRICSLSLCIVHCRCRDVMVLVSSDPEGCLTEQAVQKIKFKAFVGRWSTREFIFPFTMMKIIRALDDDQCDYFLDTWDLF